MRYLLLALTVACGLFVFSCAPKSDSVAQPAGDPLDGKEFVLTSIHSEMKIDIGFKDGRIYGFSGVNRYMGSYKASAGKIEFGSMGSTMMAGPEKNMNAETEYLQALHSVTTYEFNGETLKLGTLVYKLK